MPSSKNTQADFSQPFGKFVSRKIEHDEETIDYLPGYRYRIWHNDQPVNFGDHKHKAFEIILCTQNTYSITVENEVYKLHEGDIIFIPPMSVHSITAPETGERFIMLFDLKFFDYFKSKKEILNFFSSTKVIGINSTTHLYPLIYSSLNRIIQLYFAFSELNEVEIYSELLKIVSLMTHSTEATDEEDEKIITHSEIYNKFVRVLTYIETNYSEDLDLESVAKTAGFSKYHFSRLFKQYTDSTFYDYLCSKRILEAKKLLLTNTPVTDVAFQVGFNNLTTFCRCFKKYSGCSPTQYKNKISKEEGIVLDSIGDVYHLKPEESN